MSITDGSVHLNHGGTEMGQGLYHQGRAGGGRGVRHRSRQRAASPPTTTGKVPNTSATAASSGSDLNGMAAKAAAATIKGRLDRFRGEELGSAPRRASRFDDGQVLIGNQRDAFGELAKKAYLARISLSSTGFYATPKIHWDRRKAHAAVRSSISPMARPAREVTIDTLTGEMRVDRVDILHDVGRSLNPAHRYRPDRGRLRAGHGLAHHRGTGVRRQGPASDPCAVDLQDSLRLRRAGRFPRDAVTRARQPRGHDLPLEGGGRAAADAGDFGVCRDCRRDPQRSHPASRCRSTRRRRRNRSCMRSTR